VSARWKRGVVAVVVMLALVIAAPEPGEAFAVTDVLAIARTQVLKAVHDLHLEVVTDTVTVFRRWARKLAVVVDMARYLMPNAPLWRTRHLDVMIWRGERLMDAINGGIADLSQVDDMMEPRVGAALPHIQLWEADMALDARDSTIYTSIDQTGRIRNLRKEEGRALLRAEDAIAHAEGSLQASLDVVSGLKLTQARQKQIEQELTSSLIEMRTVDLLVTRDRLAEGLVFQAGTRREAEEGPGGEYDPDWRQP
jgi:hypothetical protein